MMHKKARNTLETKRKKQVAQLYPLQKAAPMPTGAAKQTHRHVLPPSCQTSAFGTDHEPDAPANKCGQLGCHLQAINAVTEYRVVSSRYEIAIAGFRYDLRSKIKCRYAEDGRQNKPPNNSRHCTSPRMLPRTRNDDITLPREKHGLISGITSRGETHAALRSIPLYTRNA